MILNLSQLRADYKKIYKRDWSTARKLDILIEITKIELRFSSTGKCKAKRLAIADYLSSIKKSLRSIQRWKRCYREAGYVALKKKPRGCKKKIELSEETKQRIEFYRSEYLWGSEVIQAHLLEDDGIRLTRYKIERYLDDSGLKKKYPCTTVKKQKSKNRKHTKKVVIDHPGEHTQMDVKYQTQLLQNKRKAYVYNFIDHASNWSYKRAYHRISAENTADFMRELLKVCPFKIKRLQTDNGIEFTYKWNSKHRDNPRSHPLKIICDENQIVHKLIPPGEKELQGLVERSHRQDDQEFFSRINPFDIDEFE